MPIENTCRIPREELLEILETEAPATNQRTTAPMPAITLTDLLCIRDDGMPAEAPLAEPPPQPVRRMRPNTIPAQNRSPVRAVGTDPEIKALPPRTATEAVADAVPAVTDAAPAGDDAAPAMIDSEPEAAIVISRVPTAETSPVARPFTLEDAARELAERGTRGAPPVNARTQTPVALPVVPRTQTPVALPVVPRTQTPLALPPVAIGSEPMIPQAFPIIAIPPALPGPAPVAAIADPVTAPLSASQALRALTSAPGKPRRRGSRTSGTHDMPPLPPPPVPAALVTPPPVHVSALTTLQMRPISLRSSRSLVIAAAAVLTLVLAFLLSLL